MKTKLVCALLLCFLMFSVTSAVHAQGKGAARGMSATDRAEKITEWMKKNLNLSADQIPKVAEINERYAKMADEIVRSTKSKSEKASALKYQGQSKDAELKAILDPNQFTTYLAKKSEVETKFRNKYKNKNKSHGNS